MKRISMLGALALTGAMLLAPSMAWAVTCTGNTNTNLVMNPGFETGLSYTITDWTVRFASTVDGDTGIVTSEHRSGTQSLQIGTEDGENRVSQHIAGTVAGDIYTVCFWVLPGGPFSQGTAVFRAQWNNENMLVMTNSITTTTWTYVAFNVIATGNDTLSFEGRNDNNFYYLDNVSVQECSACTINPNAAKPKNARFAPFAQH